MNEHVKELWIKALLSGEYRQEQGLLAYKHDTEGLGHCCLGVLCEVYRQETGKGEWVDLGGHLKFVDGGGDYSDTCLPDHVQEWAGVSEDPLVVVNRKRIPVPLSSLNDEGETFEEIASLIEKEL